MSQSNSPQVVYVMTETPDWTLFGPVRTYKTRSNAQKEAEKLCIQAFCEGYNSDEHCIVEMFMNKDNPEWIVSYAILSLKDAAPGKQEYDWLLEKKAEYAICIEESVVE